MQLQHNAPAYNRATVKLALANRRAELASVTGQPLEAVDAVCDALGEPSQADLDCAYRRLMEAGPNA